MEQSIHPNTTQLAGPDGPAATQTGEEKAAEGKRATAAESEAKGGGQGVTIYTTPTCPFCKMEKAYLQEKGIAYREVDVSDNPAKAQEMIGKSGQMGVPVTVVTRGGEEKVVVGFDKPALNAALGLG